ncbi:uncharacterized protein LOC131219541 isoform X2 [Magnolia sinica]|uniref:uncharacterized protein LOC131219541 isoform X2 n=1 Tax=Magnolia sinica TaxID=86752 RepID=UPI002659936F|nr:uncharacterized protein LOC131219541 isoform X2 [Magnolia sinica]
MALRLHKLFPASCVQGRSFSNLSRFPIMPQNSALQKFSGNCLPYSSFGNGGKHGKCIQLKIRKAGDNCRASMDRLKNSQLKVEHGHPLLRSLTNGHVHRDTANFNAQLRFGTLNTRNPMNIFTFRSFEADDSGRSNSLLCELMVRRFLSVKAMGKIQVPRAMTKRSNNMVMGNGQSQNTLAVQVVHGTQKQANLLDVHSNLDGGLHVTVPNLPVEKGPSKSSKSVLKIVVTAQPNKQGSRDKKSTDENVYQAAMKDVISGKSTTTAKSSNTTKNTKARVKQSQRTRSKKKEEPLSDINQPSGAGVPQVSNGASQGKRPNGTISGQTSKNAANEIHQPEETPLPVVDNQALTLHQSKKTAENSSRKRSPRKKVTVTNLDKIPAKQSKPALQVLSTGDSPLTSKSIATSARASSAAERSRPVACKVKTWSGKLGPLFPPDGKSIVVVESVAKANVIQKYLGDMFEVLPSYGHVRDLAGRSGSVRPDDDFSMVWEVPAAAWTHLKSIKVALKGAKNLILASDPDREGEAIAWHISEMLQQQDALNEGITVARVVFHEITESSIKRALQSPRDINKDLVHAYLARRALDYLIGFNISPLLWRKLPGCQSAGRVQSVALALICDRETEIDEFKSQEYWTVEVELQKVKEGGINFQSQLTHFDSNKLEKFSISSQAEAKAIEQNVTSSNFQVVGTKRSKMQRNPPTPYITSTLQQDASNRLNFYTEYTMKVAQKLYEGVKLSNDEATGLITYMRTDGLHVCDEAVKDIRSLVMERYGQDYTPKSTPKYFKVKNAQEAHEAIRPTNIRRLPSSLVGILDEDSLKLYTLIWSRTMACQMEAATVDKVQVNIANVGEAMVLRSTSSRVGFLGYQAVYKDRETAAVGHDENEGIAREEAFNVLCTLKSGDQVHLGKVELKQHHTEPPPRYSEATLVKRLEELGIGRPSTYASIMKVLKERNYVTMKSRKLFPEFRGRMVSAFLSHHFSEVTDYSFTADMETELDNVSAGTTAWKGLLKDYWARFSMYCDRAGKVDIRQVEKMLEETYGHFLFASLPDKSRRCPRYIARTIFSDDDDGVAPQKPDQSFEPKLLGLYPGSNEKIYVKNGPYGFYVQLGDDRKGFSPKRASILKAKDVESITLEDALELLRYPVTLGSHPQDQEPVSLRVSKIGFSVRHRRTVAPVPKGMDPHSVTLEKALKYLASKDAKQCGRPKGKPRVEEAMEAMFS